MGIVLLALPVPLLVLLPIIFKYHYIYLDVKTPPTKFFGVGATKSYSFRFKKIGFDHNTDRKAIFDEFYLVEYVYGSLAQAGNVVTNEAHLLSHLHHVGLCAPIVPVHADNTINDLVLPKLMHRTNCQMAPFVPIHGDNSINDQVGPNLVQRTNHQMNSSKKSVDV